MVTLGLNTKKWVQINGNLMVKPYVIIARDPLTAPC